MSQVVLITGASSGIGAALAREYDRRGARVALLARRVDRIEALAAELRDARAIRCDVCEDASVEEAFAEALEAFGRLDVVIANAGVGVNGTVEDLELDDFRRQFETNVFGALRTAKAAIAPLRATRGRLGLVGSVSGYLSLPGTGAYAMSKFSVRALADALSAELAVDGISVTHIAPGFIESEIRRTDNQGAVRDERRDPIPSFLVMRAKVAAKQMADALEARRSEAVVTLHGKAAAFLAQRFPRSMQSVARFAAKKIVANRKSSA